MAAHYLNPSGPPPERRGPPIEGEDDAVPIVPFVPVRCPSCGEDAHDLDADQAGGGRRRKPRMYGRRGRVRYHFCECGVRFRSLEIPPSEVGDLPQLRQFDL